MVFVFGILIGSAFYIYKNKDLAAKIRGFFANTFLFKNLINNYYFSNYFYVMALAYEAGVPVTEAVVMSNSVVNIPAYKKKLKKAAEMVLNGCRIATALAATNLFNSYAMSQISAGEQAGELDKMFKIVAFDYEEKMDMAIKVLLKLLEPVVMIIVGLIVLYVATKGYSAYIGGITSMF
jgi:type II secretory pathway component PulF